MMRTKTILIVVVALILAGGVIAIAKRMGRVTSSQLRDAHQNDNQIVPREKRLRWYVDQTKARGESEITLDAPFIDYAGSSASTTLDDALAHFDAVIAVPVKSEVVPHDTGEIVTWYKFKIVESLSQNGPPCEDCLTPPPSLAPFSDNEFALAKYGGTAVIDGVSVTMLDPTFPAFEQGKRYLLFTTKRGASGAVHIEVGPNGVFKIDNDTLTPINGNPHTIKTEVDGTLGKSLGRLKAHAQQLSGRP